MSDTFEHSFDLGNNNYLEIKLKYSKGGMNYFSNKTEPRGYWLHVSKVQRHNGTKVIQPFSDENFRIFLKGTKRYSSKQEKAIWNLLQGILTDIHRLWEEDDKAGILKVIRERIH